MAHGVQPQAVQPLDAVLAVEFARPLHEAGDEIERGAHAQARAHGPAPGFHHPCEIFGGRRPHHEEDVAGGVGDHVIDARLHLLRLVDEAHGGIEEVHRAQLELLQEAAPHLLIAADHGEGVAGLDAMVEQIGGQVAAGGLGDVQPEDEARQLARRGAVQKAQPGMGVGVGEARVLQFAQAGEMGGVGRHHIGEGRIRAAGGDEGGRIRDAEGRDLHAQEGNARDGRQDLWLDGHGSTSLSSSRAMLAQRRPLPPCPSGSAWRGPPPVRE